MNNIKSVTLQRNRDDKGDYYLTFRGNPSVLNDEEVFVKMVNAPEAGGSSEGKKGRAERIFPVFRQNAMNYGEYSEYIRDHGCACCSLTSMLAAYCPQYRNLRPEETITRVERKHFPENIWKKNYGKPEKKQMPVTLYGISRIFEEEGILNRYVGPFRDREAEREIRDHLRRGMPVLVEASRLRRWKGLPVSLNDRKYAGSYHTMILLGLDKKGYVIFTDSATRDWAGDRQRLKRDSLPNMISYMFPQINRKATNLYYDHRWNTGGYLLTNVF